MSSFGSSVAFLIDTGADRTVLNAAVLGLLGLPAGASQDRIGGLGGIVSSVSIETRIRLTREDGAKAHFRGEFAAVTVLEALDMCVLGRDITGLFAVIVDQPSGTVCLLRERHRYVIERESPAGWISNGQGLHLERSTITRACRRSGRVLGGVAPKVAPQPLQNWEPGGGVVPQLARMTSSQVQGVRLLVPRITRARRRSGTAAPVGRGP